MHASHTRTAPSQRVWIALLELETPFTHEIIDLADKPSEFLRLSELASGGKGKSTVPLLEMGEDVVSESLDIVRLLGKAALSKGPGSPQQPMRPSTGGTEHLSATAPGAHALAQGCRLGPRGEPSPHGCRGEATMAALRCLLRRRRFRCAMPCRQGHEPAAEARR